MTKIVPNKPYGDLVTYVSADISWTDTNYVAGVGVTVPADAMLATSSFAIAAYQLDILKLPVFLLIDDEHGDVNGVLLDHHFHKELLFQWKDFRVTGVLPTACQRHDAVSKLLERFYSTLTRQTVGLQYVTAREVDSMMDRDNVRMNRNITFDTAGNQIAKISTGVVEKYHVFATCDIKSQMLPTVMSMVCFNTLLSLTNKMMPAFFAGMPKEVSIIDIVAPGENDVSRANITAFNSMGDPVCEFDDLFPVLAAQFVPLQDLRAAMVDYMSDPSKMITHK